MTDIVERLRQVQGDNEDAREAADTIERLVGIVAARNDENGRLRAALQEIVSMTMDEPMRGVARRALEPKT